MTIETITEDYVSFEIAKLLKKKGFDVWDDSSFNSGIEVFAEYSPSGTLNKCIASKPHQKAYPAPTLQMAMKWLREVYGLHISLEPCYDYDSMHVVFLAFVQNVTDVHKFMDGRKNVTSHPNAEKSYELAIKYCLENLI